MFNRFLAGALLGSLSLSSQATPIRVEFETNITTAYDFRTKSTVDISPISGRFAIEFDDAGAEWGRDEWGPYFVFDTQRTTTPITASIPLSTYFTIEPGMQQRIYSSSQGSGGWTDVGTVPLAGYGLGYDNQGFGFYQTLQRTGYGENGYESNRHTLSIGLSRTLPIASFKPLSTLEFLQSFIGQDLAGGTATLTESYQLQRYPSTGPATLEGYRYTDRSLKVMAVTDLSTEVPEPGSFALMLAGLAAVGTLRQRRSNAPSEGRKQVTCP